MTDRTAGGSPAGKRRRSRERRNLLVGVLPGKRDLAIALNEQWYRIPVETRPRSAWPPDWLAFYEGKAVRDDHGIYRYARVLRIDDLTREELFPGEPPGDRAGRRYHVLRLGPIQERPTPVRFPRPRPLSFIGTTLRRFLAAEVVSDLFADSPLEDRLWEGFKERSIPAERQWEEIVAGQRYYLDFALFCREGKIDVETDGDSYHITPEQAPKDNRRNNALEAHGWKVLRFETKQVEQRLADCLDTVLTTVERLRGFASGTLVPTRYVQTSDGVVPQFSLFESAFEYDAPEGAPGRPEATRDNPVLDD